MRNNLVNISHQSLCDSGMLSYFRTFFKAKTYLYLCLLNEALFSICSYSLFILFDVSFSFLFFLQKLLSLLIRYYFQVMWWCFHFGLRSVGWTLSVLIFGGLLGEYLLFFTFYFFKWCLYFIYKFGSENLFEPYFRLFRNKATSLALFELLLY